MTNFLVKLFVKEGDKISDPAVRTRYGILSGVVGIVLNLLLAAGKLFAGLATASISITADALNNLTDAASSVVTLAGFKLAGQKADDGHPFGHGRIEYLAGLLVSLIILLVGVELAKTSVGKIIHPEGVTFSVASVVILAVSICVKLWMWRFNRRLGRRIRSSAMMATTTDALADVAATSAVLAGALVGHFAGVRIDGWVGVIVAIFILRAGFGAARDTLNPLLGSRPDPELVKAIRETVMGHSMVMGMHDLIIHDYGPGRKLMSFHAEVSVTADIMEAHDAIDHIERELYEKFGIETSVHIDPIATDDESVLRVRRQVVELVRAIEPDMSIHDFHMTKGDAQIDLIFDVLVPYQCPLTDEQVRQRVTRAVCALDPCYYVVLQVDRDCVENH